MDYTEFRNQLAESLNAVNDDGDIVDVSRSKGKNLVVMSLNEYNSMQETIYLTSTKANRREFDAAIDEMNKGKSTRSELIEK